MTVRNVVAPDRTRGEESRDGTYGTQPKVWEGAPLFPVPQSVIQVPEGSDADSGWKLTFLIDVTDGVFVGVGVGPEGIGVLVGVLVGVRVGVAVALPATQSVAPLPREMSVVLVMVVRLEGLTPVTRS